MVTDKDWRSEDYCPVYELLPKLFNHLRPGLSVNHAGLEAHLLVCEQCSDSLDLHDTIVQMGDPFAGMRVKGPDCPDERTLAVYISRLKEPQGDDNPAIPMHLRGCHYCINIISKYHELAYPEKRKKEELIREALNLVAKQRG